MKKQILIGIIGALGIILITNIVLQFFSFWYNLYLIRTLSVEQFYQEAQHPSFLSQSIFWIKQLCSYAVYVLAGFFSVKIINKKGWFYGGMVGLIWLLLSDLVFIGIIFYMHLAPPDAYSTKHPQQAAMQKQRYIESLTTDIPQKVLGAIFILGLTAAGGVLAERKTKKKTLKLKR